MLECVAIVYPELSYSGQVCEDGVVIMAKARVGDFRAPHTFEKYSVACGSETSLLPF